jgi:hypothetical protein
MYSLEDNPHRQIIFTKDVQKVTGLSLRGARHRLAKIRKELGKQKGELVTLTEFCAAMKIERNEVIKHMD